MEKQIVFSEKEFNDLLIKFADQLSEDWKKGWGYKVISREDGHDALENENNKELYGALMLTWDKVFK
jgi:hypothetical protein